jgi:hypothetical protein
MVRDLRRRQQAENQQKMDCDPNRMDEELNNGMSAPPNALRQAGKSGMSHVTRMGPNPAPTQIVSLLSLERLDFCREEKLAALGSHAALTAATSFVAKHRDP